MVAPYGFRHTDNCVCLDCAEEGMQQVIAKGEGKGKLFPFELARHCPEGLDSDSSEVVEDPVWTPNSPDPPEPYTPTNVDNQPADGSWLTTSSTSPSEPGLGARGILYGNETREQMTDVMPVNEP